MKDRKRLSVWVVIAVILTFAAFRYWITLTFYLAPAHDRAHLSVLTIKIVAYSVVYVVLLFTYALKVEPRPVDLLLFVVLTFLGISVFTLAYTDIYKILGLIGPGDVITRDALTCFYFSIITWTTLGYGDFRPTEPARLYAATEAALGAMFMSLSTGFFMHLLISLARVRGQRTPHPA